MGTDAAPAVMARSARRLVPKRARSARRCRFESSLSARAARFRRSSFGMSSLSGRRVPRCVISRGCLATGSHRQVEWDTLNVMLRSRASPRTTIEPCGEQTRHQRGEVNAQDVDDERNPFVTHLRTRRELLARGLRPLSGVGTDQRWPSGGADLRRAPLDLHHRSRGGGTIERRDPMGPTAHLRRRAKGTRLGCRRRRKRAETTKGAGSTTERGLRRKENRWVQGRPCSRGGAWRWP
jgi:hypothetical protein